MAIELGFRAEVLVFGRAIRMLSIPDVAQAVRPMLRRSGAVGKPAERDRRPTEKELEDLDTIFRFNLFARIPMRDLIPFAIDSLMRLDEIMNLR